MASLIHRITKYFTHIHVVAAVGILLLSYDGNAQIFDDDGNNRKPKIRGQRSLTTNEEQPITISFFDLEVDDDDDFYPIGFSMELFPGPNYSLSDKTVTPSKDFYGTLTVPVRVNDGEDDSEKFDLKITVNNINDPPVITGQQSLNANSGIPFTVQLSYLTVQDPDDEFPSDFTLKVSTGENYSVAGDQITPASNFEGSLTVNLRVNDGAADSETFGLKIQVTKLNTKPLITSQTPALINEDESFVFSTSNLRVNDPAYPSGYTFALAAGTNYTVTNGNTIVPATNFNGNLFVSTTVTNGEKTSDPYNFLITVNAVNDAPVLTLNDSSAIRANFGESILPLSSIDIMDIDDETLNIAEIAIDPETYQQGVDVISFTNTELIRGVFDTDNGILALIGKASIADYKTAIQSVSYNLAAPNSSRTSTSLFVSVSDGKATSKTVKKIVSFTDTVVGSFDIPSGFTPNGDLVNDTWSVRSLDNSQSFTDAIIRVYTKSGLKVYEGVGLSSEWDGMYNGVALPADVYFYTVELTNAPNESSVKGIVTLLR
jgi:gliding motility-associated-like protein